MSDKDLPVSDLVRILRVYGFSVEIVKGVLKVSKSGTPLGWQQHLHKGEGDTLQRRRVKAARRRLKLTAKDGVSDEDFYSRK